MVELGWKSFVDNLNCWENCEGNLESWVDDWKNYWNDGNLHGLTVGGHCCVGSMRNLGDFSNQDCTSVMLVGLENAAFIFSGNI